MKIAVACDHGGLNLKNALIAYLKKNGHEVKNFGTDTLDSCDYPDFASKAAKAVANGDTELITKVLERKEQLKEKARKKNIKRVVKSHTLRKEEIFQRKQPKSKDYTKHHKQIIRNEIPFDKVHTNELIAIYQKARNNKDDVLADLVFDEISEFTSSYTALQQPCREYERNQAYVPYIS